jgi:hypothetical protein
VHDAARQVQHVPRRERELGRVRAWLGLGLGLGC